MIMRKAGNTFEEASLVLLESNCVAVFGPGNETTSPLARWAGNNTVQTLDQFEQTQAPPFPLNHQGLIYHHLEFISLSGVMAEDPAWGGGGKAPPKYLSHTQSSLFRSESQDID